LDKWDGGESSADFDFCKEEFLFYKIKYFYRQVLTGRKSAPQVICPSGDTLFVITGLDPVIHLLRPFESYDGFREGLNPSTN